MSIVLNTKPTDRILELGGGANRNPAAHVNVDVRPGPNVDFTADFNQPLPIKDEDFDGVFSQYTLEHLSWRNVGAFLKECYRILKPGGTAVFVVPNTEAQIKWMQNNPNGWDGRNFFESASCVLFGDQDYPENSHRLYLNPAIGEQLMKDAGFVEVTATIYGERDTDMVLRGVRVAANNPSFTYHGVSFQGTPSTQQPIVLTPTKQPVKLDMTPEQMYDKQYFNGGGKVGGYAREGYWDYPCHEITARHILARKPESVLELGCARGYVLKRIQDTGIEGYGVEVSKHCYHTRVADRITCLDLLCGNVEYWKDHQHPVDLCYSVAVLEHIPEDKIDRLVQIMKYVSKRGLHAIDFGEKDDGFDKTHCLLRSREWWINKFKEHDYPCEVIDKEEIEAGTLTKEYLQGDGKIKVNVGSFTTMYHHGWINMDVHNLTDFANAHRYKFVHHDLRNGLPFQTGTVDMISASHFLEHLDYKEGQAFLKECRRVLKPTTGAIRIAVPCANILMRAYEDTTLDQYGEINEICADPSKTDMEKLFSLLHDGHKAQYDGPTLLKFFKEASFEGIVVGFRGRNNERPRPMRNDDIHKQILTETLDMFATLSLYVIGTPIIA